MQVVDLYHIQPANQSSVEKIASFKPIRETGGYIHKSVARGELEMIVSHSLVEDASYCLIYCRKDQKSDWECIEKFSAQYADTIPMSLFIEEEKIFLLGYYSFDEKTEIFLHYSNDRGLNWNNRVVASYPDSAELPSMVMDCDSSGQITILCEWGCNPVCWQLYKEQADFNFELESEFQFSPNVISSNIHAIGSNSKICIGDSFSLEKYYWNCFSITNQGLQSLDCYIPADAKPGYGASAQDFCMMESSDIFVVGEECVEERFSWLVRCYNKSVSEWSEVDRVGSVDRHYFARKIISARDGSLVVAGYYEESGIFTLLLRRWDGLEWTSIYNHSFPEGEFLNILGLSENAGALCLCVSLVREE